MLEKNLKMSITTAYFPSENRKIVELGFFPRGWARLRALPVADTASKKSSAAV